MNTKKINFDWSIFIAFMTIFVVIICGVVCCCLALPSNNNGIAKAQENVDYLVAPGDSYTSSEKCSSIVQDATLQILQNIIYINFNYQFVEEEFFALFNSTFSDDYTEDSGGLNEDYYCYPLISIYVNHGGNLYPKFSVVALGWSDFSEYNGIYIFDDNVVINDDFINYIALHNYYEFDSAYREFIVTAFYKFQYSDMEMFSYTSIVSRNLINYDEDFLQIVTYFDSTRLTDYFFGTPYQETLLPFFDSLLSLNGVFNNNSLYVAPNVSGVIGDEDYSFQGYGFFNYNVEKQYLKTIADEFISYIRDGNTYTYNELSGLVYILASFSVSTDPHHFYFGIRDDDSLFVIVNEEEGYFAPPYGIYLDTFLPFGSYGDSYYLYNGNFGFSYISPFWYSEYCSLDIGMFFSMSDNFLSYGDVQVLKQQKAFNAQLSAANNTIQNLNSQIVALQDDISDLQDEISTLQGNNDNLINQISQLQQQINELNAQLQEVTRERDEYYVFYQQLSWAPFVDSNYNNLKTVYFDGMKTTVKAVYDIGGGNVGVMLIDDSGTANGLIGFLGFGQIIQSGRVMKLSWKDLRIQYQTGSSGDGGFLPVHIAVMSGDSLIDVYVTNEETIIDGSFEFTLPVDADGLYFYNSEATTYLFISGLVGYMNAYDGEVIYQNGYDAGVIDGYADGHQSGEQSGYQKGYADALEIYADTDISFFALLTSVVDAPIQMIVGKWNSDTQQMEGGMLNFYIPGLDINLAPFLLSMFTICIVVMVVRFILARKE